MTRSALLAARQKTSGAALIITLAVLVLMTLMVVSLNDLMRIERGAAHAHVEKSRAELLSQGALGKVVAQLQKATANPTRTWISQPGQLVAGAADGSSKILKDSILLHSGRSSHDPIKPVLAPIYWPAELNVSTFDPPIILGNPPNDLKVQPHLITNLPDPLHPDDYTRAVPMALRWKYLRADGTVYPREDGTEDGAPEKPVIGDPNSVSPIVGRYAYWTDDESSKVNYNLAWTRAGSNPNPPSHPSKINLPTLLGGDAAAETMATAMHLYQAAPISSILATPATAAKYNLLNRFFFNSPQDARQVEQISAGVYNALNSAKFSVTHYNHDPDTTFFNEPRIVLTTQPERAGWTYDAKQKDWVGTNGKTWNINPKECGLPLFLNILKTDPLKQPKRYANAWDPIDHIDPIRMADVIYKLNDYLKRIDWPMAPGASLQSKYYSSYTPTLQPERLTQISLNIINYVRSKECLGDDDRKTETVVPVRGEKIPGPTTRFVMMEIATTASSYIGITRTPKITEMGVWVGPNVIPNTTNSYPTKFKAEIYLPLNFGLDQIDLTALNLYVSASKDSKAGAADVIGFSQESRVIASEVTIPGRPAGTVILRAGEYATITRNSEFSSALNGARVKFNGARSTADSTIALRFAIAVKRRLDVTPLGNPATCTLNMPATAESQISSIEVDDPRINSHKDDWKPNINKASPFNSFGLSNSISTLKAPPKVIIIPEQDLDRDGRITDISLVMPAPPLKGNALSANPNGIMASSGELGYISTGMESSFKAGTPWRTLHLQPNKQPVTVVPDWAFMDLFTVPLDVPPDAAGKPSPKPSPKAFYSPHGTAIGGRVNMNARPEPFNLGRIQPLAAVVQGARTDGTNLTSLTSYSAAQILADNIYNRKLSTKGGKQYGYQTGYDSPGEVVEMAGVADRGEESEQLVRDIANLITSRGNVFSVYTIGQALKQTPAGALLVTGEQRQQTMVERYLDSTTSPLPTVRFRSVYSRNLTP